MIFPWLRRPELRVLLVCRANVCRSPMAEALLRHHLRTLGAARRVGVSSAGTAALAGQRPDPRGVRALMEKGIPPVRRRSRPLRTRDFERHDYILAADREVLEALRSRVPAGRECTLHLLTHWSGDLHDSDIPDPYYANPAGFERVRDLMERALAAFVERALLPALLSGEKP